MKNKIKNEKGSMAVYVIICILTFIIILTGIFTLTGSIRKNQLKILPKIKQVYEKALDNKQEIYEEINVKQGYIKNGLILHYDGINNTGSGHSNTVNVWKDLSARNNDGDLIGFDSNSGWQEDCIKFDGINDYVISKNNLGISGDIPLTMCAVASWEGENWLSQWPSYVGINYTADYQGLSMTMYEGRPAIDFWNYRYIANNALVVKKIYQICVIKETGSINNTSKIYVDGQQVLGTGNSDTSANIVNAQAVVGRLDNTRWSNAKIYNVKFYNRALTNTEIQKNYLIDKKRYGF